MLIPARRAGAIPAAVVKIVVLTAVAALMVTAAVLPVTGIFGVAVRDTAATFDKLPVGRLGAAPQRSVIYDSQGHVIAYLYPDDVYRVPVGLSKISRVMQHAIVAIEDSSFYSQGALDPRGTGRALLHNSGGSGLQGASTIAQQYVKNIKVLQAGTNQAAVSRAIYPDLRRKVQDLRLAADVEHELSQSQLLDSYLNVAYFDHNAWGIEVASEVYFSEHASQLTLPQAALLAGIVQSPTAYDPRNHPDAATARRNTVLMRMAQLHYITQTTATEAEKEPLALHMSKAPLSTGCTSPQAAPDAFFCDYVEHVLQNNYKSVWNQVNNTGGLAIYTTLNRTDQMAADHAVNSVEPRNAPVRNPGNNADVEVLVQPGTGAVRAIAENRAYGNDGADATYIDYAVNKAYSSGGGSNGVQTGSSSKIFTLVTALEHGDPFGHQLTIGNPETFSDFTDCQGAPVDVPPQQLYHVANAEAPFKGTETYQLGEATVESVNTYFVDLEKQVGLCNVVKTASAMGMTRADGVSLLQNDPAGPPADQVSSFTLGSVLVSPMSMAAAYATVASGGVYCSPQAITKIVVMSSGRHLPVQGAGCHQAIPSGVAAAANYVLQRVLTSPAGTAYPRSIPGHTAAAKTGTADKGYYAAFAGWTPTLTGYVSVFNPVNPTHGGAMVGDKASWVDVGGVPRTDSQGQMFGDDAPGATWQVTFNHAALGADIGFPAPPARFLSLGSGFGAPFSCARPPVRKKGPIPILTCPPSKHKKKPKPGPSGPPLPGPQPPGGPISPPIVPTPAASPAATQPPAVEPDLTPAPGP